MANYETHRIKCPDRDCKAVFEVEAMQTDIQQTNYTSCPSCGEEFRFPKSGYWSIKNDTRVVVGHW